MYIKNENRCATIEKILKNIQKEIKIDFQKEDNSLFYINGSKRILNMIEKETKKHFPMCQINYVSKCYPDGALPCDNWRPDKIGSEWCLNKCTNRILEINTKDITSEEKFIQKCFNL